MVTGDEQDVADRLSMDEGIDFEPERLGIGLKEPREPDPRAERDALIAATAAEHGMTVATQNIAHVPEESSATDPVEVDLDEVRRSRHVGDPVEESAGQAE